MNKLPTRPLSGVCVRVFSIRFVSRRFLWGKFVLPDFPPLMKAIWLFHSFFYKKSFTRSFTFALKSNTPLSSGALNTCFIRTSKSERRKSNPRHVL
jgi:hypothetical protein